MHILSAALQDNGSKPTLQPTLTKSLNKENDASLYTIPFSTLCRFSCNALRKKLSASLSISLAVLLAISLLFSLVACGGSLSGNVAGDGNTGDASSTVGDGRLGVDNGGSDGNGNGNGNGNSNGGSGNGNGNGSADSNNGGNAAQGNAASVLSDGDISGSITISAYESMTYRSSLEAAAQAFNEKYPDVEIVVDTFSAMPEFRRSESADGRTAMMSAQMIDDPQERADYANKVNTALMSGEGADILAVDVIPIAKYVESGLLVDLAPYMEQDPGFDPSQYRTNILDAVSWNGGTWFLPMDYMFDYFTYDSTLITTEQADFGADSAYTIEQLVDLAIPSFDGVTKILNTPAYTGIRGGLWQRLLREHWSEFVDIPNKKAHFTDGAFANLLNTMISYNNEGYVPEASFGEVSREVMMDRMSQAPTDRYYFKPTSNMSLLTYFMRSTQSRFNIGFSMSGNASIDDDDELAGISANTDGTVPFTYTQAYAINSNSKNKQAAWEFIKFMLSGEIQASGSGGILRGLPIHNATRENQMENMMTSMAVGLSSGGGGGAPGAFGRVRDPGSDALGWPGETQITPGGGKPGDTDANSAANAIAEPSGGAPSGTPGDAPGGAPGGAPGDASGGPSGDSPGSVPGSAPDGDISITGEQVMSPEDFLADIDPEIYKRYNEAVEKFSDQINTFEIKDAIIDDMIEAEINYFFEGEKTAEEVAATLQSKVELYLNE